ncbi:retention module-containing protein [Campylobacter concisus]|uniref:retention module-containing protein n=1 Tax=Campylobacter concisus TaxID=199 RepID=UPI000CD82E66|nr:retention module-containing protein [Campylobacter concisus]
MAREAGVVKSLTGKAVAVDQNGNARELKVGDIVYIGESIKTSDAADKVTIVANNGKEITILGDDTLALNQNTIGSDGLADVSALQNAILNGGDLTKLEETAAGGNAAAAGGGDGVSLSDARFAEGGHYSNINENYRNLTDANRAFASYDSPIGGYNDGNDDSNREDGSTATPVTPTTPVTPVTPVTPTTPVIPNNPAIIPGAPTVKFINDINGNHTLSRVEHGNDTNINTSKVLITVPNDGTVRAGDVLKVTVTDPNGNETTTNVTITPAIITNGYPINAPVEPGKNSKVEASVTNFQGNTSGSSEDHVTPTKSSVSVEFTEDKSPDDGFLTYTENKGDGKQNESPVLIKVSDVIIGDKLHITLTKPDGTTEPREVTIDQNIINNGYKIDNMPVADGKVSKVDAYVTDSSNSNTWKSDVATDKVTPDNPTIRFTEDGDNNGFLTDAENKGTDGNFRTSPVEITLPKDVVAGDKIVITYTDPLNPTGPKLNLPPIELTNEMITNHKVTGIEIPIFPGVETKASVHVVDKDGNQKSEESAPDSVTPQTIKMDMNLPEQQTLHEISRQESVSNYKKTYDGVEIDLGDQKVNHTTAKITLPNRIVNGDILTLHVTKPDGTPYDRNFKINVNEKGVITSVDEIDNAGHAIGNPYNTANKNFFKEDINQWAIKVDGFELENGKDTKIKAEVTHPTHPANPYLPTEENSKSASLEYVKKPEVIFDEAHGAKTMTREQAISDGGLNSTTVTIKLPKNAVNGDKINVTITNPDGTIEYKHYTVEKDATGKLTGITNNDNASDHVTIKNGNSFEIPNIKTATGVKTEVKAEIVDNDGSIQHAESSNNVMIAGLNDMAVRFVEDIDGNVSLTRAESMKDGNLKETTIAVKVPNNVIAGDIVTVKIDNDTSHVLKKYSVVSNVNGEIKLEHVKDDGTKETITTNATKNNEIEISNVKITAAGKPINVTAETTDASGGKKAEAQNHNTLEKLHDDMKITFDKDDGDGILGNAEATGTETKATIKLPSNFVLGDKLKVESYNEDTSDNKTTKTYEIEKDEVSGKLIAKNGSEELDITDDADGNKVVKYTLGLTKGHKTIINAKVTGAAGDESETKSDIILDTGNGSGTRFRLLIDEDEDRNGVLDRKEAMTDHQLNTTSATLQIPTNVNVGDTITVIVNGGSPKTYKVASNNGTKVTIEDAQTHAPVTLETGNKLKISGVHIDKDHPAKVDVTIRDHAGNEKTATAEAKLETFDATNLKVNFIEDDASRDGKIDRDESVSVDGVEVTTISVQVPYNVISGDKVSVTINEPQKVTQADGTIMVSMASRTLHYTVSKASDGKISLIDDSNPTHTLQLKNNTFEIHDVKMYPGKDTSATATITNAATNPADNMSATSEEAKAQLAPLSKAGLSVSIADDKNDDGVISRDESGSNTSKVKVSIPGSVIKGDKIDVEITNPDNSKVTKHYEVENKDVNGNITLKDVTDPNHPFTIVDENNDPKKFNASNPLELDADIAVDKDTVAKVTLTDAFDKSVSVEDKAQHAEIDAMRGIMFEKDIKTLEESGEKTTTAKFFLSEDARAGDTVEIKYTDPNDHSQMKPVNHVLTADDISNGVFEQSLDIDARSSAGYDLKVEATLKTLGTGGLHSKTYETDQSFHINADSYTIKYDASKTMKGGNSDNDTLVVDGHGQTIDFSHVAGLDAKVESFENIQLKGNSEIKFNAKAIFDITDDLNTVLKIKGAVDEHGNSTTKVDLDHKWTADSNYDASGFKGYSSVDQVEGKTLHIQIEDKIQTDL